MNTPDDFCQWCYDRGLRYSRPGPWAHAIDCPNRLPAQPETPIAMNTTDQPTPEQPGNAICPDCGRIKAASAQDAMNGLCPKWWAIRDEDAEKDCAAHTPEPGWRMLDVGEVILKGDEMDEPEGWKPCQSSVGIPLLKGYSVRRRRPYPPKTPSGPPDALPPKDEAQGQKSTCPFCRGQDFAANAHEGHTPFVCPHCRPAHGETDTPRTDAASFFFDGVGPEYCDATFARELERALAAAERELQRLEQERQNVERFSNRLIEIANKIGDTDPINDVIEAQQAEIGLLQSERDAALAELQAIKSKPLPVPQTPQEHMQEVMKSGFDRWCG